VNEAAFTAVGPAPKSNNPAWFTPPYDSAIIEAAAARNSLFAKLRSIAPTSPLLASTKKALQVARTKVRKLTRKAKAAFISIQAKALNDSSDPKSANHSRFWKLAEAFTGKGTRGKSIAMQTFQNSDGSICTSPEENAEAAKTHVTQLFNNTQPLSPKGKELTEELPQHPTRHDLDNPFSMAELETALCRAKSNKATSNNVPVELYKVLDNDGKQILLSICNEAAGFPAPEFQSSTTTPAPTPAPPSLPTATTRNAYPNTRSRAKAPEAHASFLCPSSIQ
jgi:hypothetical protein